MGNRRTPVTESDDLDYRLPRDKFLTRSNGTQKTDVKGIERGGRQVVEALAHFSVDAQVTGTVSGPHVTRYELRLAPGIKMSKVANLKDDLAYAMAAEHVRILAPIPGKQAVGVEVPNRVRKMVHLGDVLQESPPKWSPLTVWLGKDIGGKSIGTDLAKQPHVLVAGTTGSGKSGCVNAMLSSILLRATPNEVRLVLVDPKRVELNHYEHIPHLLTPVITSPRLAANALANLIKEMEERYDVMSAARTRNLEELNRARLREGERPLPYILCVIDELADLMMIAPGEVEDSIIRLAQKSRAVGIHLLLATQRPSADVITGMIKANVPARIAFAVASQTDSRVILDQNGAESLLGQGDMLFRPAGESRSARIQGAFIDEDQILKLTDHWRRQGEPELQEELLEAVEHRGRARRRRRVQRRPGRPARRRHRHGGPDGHRLDLDAPAAPAGRLHARGAADRHDGAPRRDLRLRGLEGPPGADHRGRPAARAGAAGRPDGRAPPRTSSPSFARIGAVPPIGETLRQARMRHKLDIADVEARTKIRAKYLRALENEEFGVLPGPTTVRSFIRTYAELLGLDPHPLVEEYRQQSEDREEADIQPVPAPSRGGDAASARAHGAPPPRRRRGGAGAAQPAGPDRRHPDRRPGPAGGDRADRRRRQGRGARSPPTRARRPTKQAQQPKPKPKRRAGSHAGHARRRAHGAHLRLRGHRAGHRDRLRGHPRLVAQLQGQARPAEPGEDRRPS